MSQPSPRPFPQARLLNPHEPAPEDVAVWLYEGALEQFTGAGAHYAYRQRIAFPADAEWEQVQELGRWMVERLSVNGHLLVGLRARREDEPAEAARLIPA